MTPTWFKLYGSLENQCLVAWNGGKPLWKITSTSSLDISDTLDKYKDEARTFHRAEDDEIIPDVPEYSEDEKLPEPDKPLSGLKVFLEAGHGWTGNSFDPGAVGFVKEWEQNKEQATICGETLEKLGASVRVELYNQGTPYRPLRERGAISDPCHIFVSFHCNSFSGNAQGTETLVDRLADSDDVEFGATVHKHLVQATGLTDRVHARGGETRKLGVIKQGLGVLRGAKKASFAACLTEGYFVSSPIPVSHTTMNSRVAFAVAKGIREYAIKNRQKIGW